MSIIWYRSCEPLRTVASPLVCTIFSETSLFNWVIWNHLSYFMKLLPFFDNFNGLFIHESFIFFLGASEFVDVCYIDPLNPYLMLYNGRICHFDGIYLAYLFLYGVFSDFLCLFRRSSHRSHGTYLYKVLWSATHPSVLFFIWVRKILQSLMKCISPNSKHSLITIYIPIWFFSISTLPTFIHASYRQRNKGCGLFAM